MGLLDRMGGGGMPMPQPPPQGMPPGGAPPGQPPISLGVVDTTWTHEIDVPEDLRWALADDVDSLLAVSLEPEGGAPGGAPTGPVVAKGAIDL